MRTHYLLVLALLPALVACPKRGGGGATPRRTSIDLTTLVPARSIAVGQLDVPTLLARPGAQEERELVRAVVEKVRSELGVDPSLLRDTVLFYAPLRGEGIPVRLGALVPADLQGSPGLAERKGSTDYAGRTIHALGKAARVSFLGEATVLGDELSIRSVLDVRAGKARALPADAGLWGLLRALRSFPFRIALRLEGLASVLRRLPIPAELRSLKMVGVGFDLPSGALQIEARIPTADPGKLAARLKALLGGLAQRLQGSFLKMLGHLLAGVKIRPTDDMVAVGLQIPMAIARGVARGLLGWFKLR